MLGEGLDYIVIFLEFKNQLFKKVLKSPVFNEVSF